MSILLYTQTVEMNAIEENYSPDQVVALRTYWKDSKRIYRQKYYDKDVEYRRKYRERNKERLSEYNRLYYQRKKEEKNRLKCPKALAC